MEGLVKRPPFPSMLLFVLVGLVTLLIALASPTAPASAQVVTQTPAFPLIDLVVDSHLPRIATYQATYALNHSGRYFQGLWSHSTTPDESSSTPPDQLTGRPTDQLEDFNAMWTEVRIGLGRLPCRIRIDVYNGPQGQGYVVMFETSRLGAVYARAINVGPETWRESGWTAVTVSAQGIDR